MNCPAPLQAGSGIPWMPARGNFAYRLGKDQLVEPGQTEGQDNADDQPESAFAASEITLRVVSRVVVPAR